MNNVLENCPFTLNTTRICSNNTINTAIEISKIGFSSMKPNAVILVNKNDIFDAIAATSLIHFPINASLLFTDGNSLNKETLKEIQRLSPKGYKGIQVILVGNISKNVSSELKDYGFRTQHILGRNHYETACIISKVRKEFKNILIMSGEEYSEGIISGYWSAHHGDPILFVQRNRIPECVLEVIKKMDGVNIYIIGSTKTVSNNFEKYFSQLDNVKQVDRIDGDNPYEIAVNFAKYKDPKTEFGWGRNYKEGHAFTFGVLKEPMDIVAGVLFAHMGKHTPPLLIEKDRVPEVVKRYIKSVKPMPPQNMPKPPFMHGYILGSTQNVTYKVQVMIEQMLSIDHEMMDMDEHMMEMNHETPDMYDEKMNMHHEMMNMENHEHCSDCMGMHNMNHQGKVMGMEHETPDMHDEKMDMHHEMMNMENHEHCQDCMDMHSMNHQGKMMEMEHQAPNIYDEKMTMHHQMMNMEANKHCSDCMYMHNMNHQGEMMEMEHEVPDMHDKKMSMDDDMNKIMSMHHQMMNMEADKHYPDCMYMHYMNHQGEMMEMEHEAPNMYDEKMGSDDDMNKMMSMHHKMMYIDDEDTMKHEHFMHHMNKDNDEEDEMSKMKENMEYTHEVYMNEEDDKNYEEKPCGCKKEINRDNSFESQNIKYRLVSIDDILG